MKNQVLGKFLYALLFLIVLPAILWYWAYLTSDFISWKTFHYPLRGIIAMALGAFLMLWGMWALWYYGKGLPMNAYPPVNFVSEGPYKLFNHPIYVGFCLLIIGYSLYSTMTGMQWLVAPITILGVVALVIGFERFDLNHRFGKPSHNALFELPFISAEKATVGKRIVMLVLVLGAVAITNMIINKVKPTPLMLDNESWLFSIKKGVDFILIIILAGIYLAPLLLRDSKSLRSWVVSSLVSTFLILYICLLTAKLDGLSFILLNDTNHFISTSRLQPSYISLLVPGVSGLLISSFVLRKILTQGKLWFDIAFGILLFAMLSVCRNSWTQLISGMIIFLISYNLSNIWRWLLKLSEKIANSWHETIIGPVRIINHGIYVGVGALLGTFMIGGLAGEENMWGIVIFAITVTVCSALWAQLIEGSDKLKRPFGFYGALIGIIFAGLLVWYLAYDVWAIIGATSVAMPWIQGIGRLRCLINGCCHGSPIENPELGIKYQHYRSRVVSISKMKGQSLHPTQVYSITWLFFAGFVLLAMWQGRMSPAFIFGMYLILNGIGRFVEEAYRGEVQTPSANKLRLYQWTAIGSVLCGIIMTCIPIPFPELSHSFGWNIPIGALIIGLFIFFVMGVDFPGSNARFSRLV